MKDRRERHLVIGTEAKAGQVRFGELTALTKPILGDAIAATGAIGS